MGNAANEHHQRIRPTDMARAEQRPKLSRARLKEVGHEQIQSVPEYWDDNTDAKSPRAISASEYDDGHINQCLEHMQEAKLRNKESRHRQGKYEQCNSNSNGYVYPAGSGYQVFFHTAPYGEGCRKVPACDRLPGGFWNR